MSLTRRVCLIRGGELGKLKRKHNKRNVKIEQFESIAKKAAEKGELVIIDDPCYELDDMLRCY